MNTKKMTRLKPIHPIKNNLVVYLMVLGIFLLISCDKSTKSLERLNQIELNRELNATESQVKSNQNIYAEGGQRLSDAATQFTDASKSEFQNHAIKSVDEHLQQFVGRYRAEIDCRDPMMHCKTGVAEFVLNLLVDGTSHRTIIHLGAIKPDSTREYYDDHWSYDAPNHQIVVHRASGVFFFYDIKDNGNLSFNLERTSSYNENNDTFFEQKNLLPMKAYVLKKLD